MFYYESLTDCTQFFLHSDNFWCPCVQVENVKDTPNLSSTAPLCVGTLALNIGLASSPSQLMNANLTVGMLSTRSVCGDWGHAHIHTR